jgi:hypothetical protein
MDESKINIVRPAAQTGISKIEIPDAVQKAMQASRPLEAATKYPSEPIGLPSEGYFYDESNPLSKGIVDIKYMTAKEEDILTSQNLLKKGVVLERLLTNLIVTPGVKLDDILIGDKNALFVASRRLAYGDSYGPLKIACRGCGEESEKTIDLSSIKNNSFDFSKFKKGQNRFEFILPISKKEIVYKLLTHKDEIEVEAELEAINKKFKGGTSPEITTRLKKLIISINGNETKGAINKFVDEELSARDSLALREYIRENTPNVDMEYDFVCDECNHKERIDIPLTVQFFWPNIRI